MSKTTTTITVGTFLPSLTSQISSTSLTRDVNAIYAVPYIGGNSALTFLVRGNLLTGNVVC